MTDTPHLRAYARADAAALAQVFHDAVHQIGARDYSPAQVTAWSAAPVPADTFHARVNDGRHIWVATDAADHPIGFIELERTGHIDCFYLAPAHAGTGVGAALYQTLEATARDTGLNTLWVEASEAAKRFFTRAGFTDAGRRDFRHNGVWIHNYRMTKDLRDHSPA